MPTSFFQLTNPKPELPFKFHCSKIKWRNESQTPLKTKTVIKDKVKAGEKGMSCVRWSTTLKGTMSPLTICVCVLGGREWDIKCSEDTI